MILYDWILEQLFPLFISVEKLNIMIPFIDMTLQDIFSVVFVLALSFIFVGIFLYCPYKIFIRLCKGPKKHGK